MLIRSLVADGTAGGSGVVLAAAGLGGGWAGMMELLYGGDGASIGEALAKGTAVGFIFGMILGFARGVPCCD